MILRFDDTNPINEKGEFVENIIKDLKRLDIIPDIVSNTSDHFGAIENACRKLITDGKAYADDTPAEQMKLERDAGIESKHRKNTPE
jgi:bifunctional glutamyl/prolyl-tRNA synthetase